MGTTMFECKQIKCNNYKLDEHSLFFTTGLFWGIKLFMINPIYHRYPKVNRFPYFPFVFKCTDYTDKDFLDAL